ncbi:MAG: polyhydroxyalkanoic acid system family protein [Pirellulales bacterium]|nr:polyhydroxyalkanoic acid system family protein [Pirellulales bacterium]
MPQLSVSVPHALGREEALRRLRNESDVAKSAFGDRVRDLVEDWGNDGMSFRFSAMGMAVEGNVAVEEAAVTTTAKLPLAAMMFKGLIEQRLRDRLAAVLAAN